MNSVKNRAYRLDLLLNLCGLRIGWAGVIGLIPWIGDIIAFYFALQLVRKARTIEGGLPKGLEAEMMANVMFDFGIGLIPIVGDFINVLYKCNSRNFILLEKYLVKKYGAIANPLPPSNPSVTQTPINNNLNPPSNPSGRETPTAHISNRPPNPPPRDL